MTTTDRTDQIAGVTWQDQRFGARATWGVLVGLLVTTLGLSLNVVWQQNGFPDTFLTPSRMAIYAGACIVALTSLAVTSTATRRQRQGRSLPRLIAGTVARSSGSSLTVPLGYLVAGAGAATTLVVGAVDLGWNAVNAGNSPLQAALRLSTLCTAVGSIIICVPARLLGWGRAGLFMSIPTLLTNALLIAVALPFMPLPFAPGLALAILIPAVLTFAGVVLHLPGRVFGISVATIALQALLVSGLAEWPVSLPLPLLGAALAIELALAAERRRSTAAPGLVVVGGAVAGAILAVTLPLSSVLESMDDGAIAPYFVGVVIGAACGALGGYVGLRMATLLTVLPSRRAHSRGLRSATA